MCDCADCTPNYLGSVLTIDYTKMNSWEIVCNGCSKEMGRVLCVWAVGNGSEGLVPLKMLDIDEGPYDESNGRTALAASQSR